MSDSLDTSRLEDLDSKAPVVADVEESLEKRREAVQAHKFREYVFQGIGVLCAAIAFVWVLLMANSPATDAPAASFHLWMLKLSLCTILLGTVAVGLLRFAIQCYGHHQKAAVPEHKVPMMLDLSKIVEAAAKSSSASAP